MNVDQGLPQNNLKRTPDGKYIYKMEDGSFDIDKFNRDFDQYKIKRNESMEKQLQTKIDQLNKPEPEIPIWSESIGTVLIRMKDSIFGIFDDILNFNISSEIFIKENRLFYIGLFILFFALILFVLNMLIGLDENNQNIDKYVVVKHEYIKSDSKFNIIENDH